MPALREIYAEYGIEFDRDRDLQRGDREVTGLRSRLRGLTPVVAGAASALTGFATVAGGAAAAGLARMVSATVDSTREIQRWSERLGISQGALREWTELSREFGADIDDVTDAFKELQLRGQDAISGGTEQAEMFQRIGISIDDLRPIINDTEALMSLFTSRLDQVSDAGLRNFTVDEIMSDAGTRLLGVFNLGSQEISRRRQAIGAAIGPTEGLTAAVEAHSRRVRDVTRRWERFQRDLTARILPILGRVIERLSAFSGPLRDILEQTNILQGALVAFGVVAVGVAVATIAAWGPMALAIIAVAAAAAVVAVAFDQISRTIEGGDTALRRFLDDSDRLGEGGTTGIVLLLGDAWDRLTGRISGAVESMRPVLTILGRIWDLYSSFSRIASGGFVFEALGDRMAGDVRGAAQARNAQETERQRTAREARDRTNAASARRVASQMRLDPTTGEGVDAFGFPTSMPAGAAPRRSPSFPALPTSRPPQRVSIEAPMTVSINVAEAQDAYEVSAQIRRQLDESWRRQIREIEAMITETADESEAST